MRFVFVIESISRALFFFIVRWRKIQTGRQSSTNVLRLLVVHSQSHPTTLSTMLSQLKAREVTPAPGETGKKDDAASSEKTAVSDAEQQAAARLTCDALCSLANGIKGPSVPSTHSPAAVTPPVPTMPTSISGQPLGLHGFLYRGVVEPVAVSTPPTPPPTTSSAAKTVPIRSTTNRSATTSAKTSTKIKNCPKQHQLPLFLSSKFILIDSVDVLILYVEKESWSAHWRIIQFFRLRECSRTHDQSQVAHSLLFDEPCRVIHYFWSRTLIDVFNQKILAFQLSCCQRLFVLSYRKLHLDLVL